MQEPVTMVVNRDNVFEETLNQFATVGDLNLQGAVKIFFIDEEADDAGGVIREWIDLMVDHMFKQEAGIFEAKENEGEIFYCIRPDAPIDLVQMAGKVIGKALFEQIPISVKINPLLLREICHQDLELEDLEHFDAQLFRSLEFCK